MNNTKALEFIPGNTSSKLLNAKEVAEILNISKAFAYKLMQTGEITTVFIGSSRRVRMADLEEFIIRNTQPQQSRFGIK
jgi:excisionase family DNA binding protein